MRLTDPPGARENDAAPMSQMTATDVLVVGAGPGGLATAVSALRHGARVLLIERRPSTSSIPRATGVSTRTMEIFRTWGVDDAVRAGAVDCDPRVHVARTLSDDVPRVQANAFPGVREALAASPAFPAICPQDHIEPVLAGEVRRLGGEIRFGTALRGLRTTADGVRADLGDGGRVRAGFVVGADGPRSAVRAALGIGVEHLGSIGDHVQLLFRADIEARLGRTPPGIAFLDHPEAPGVLLPVGGGRWAYVHGYDPALGESPGDYTPARWRALLRAATGMPDLEPELLGALPFTMAADVAATFRAGPGFLVGDAAHRMTPVAGAGLNTAVHDGHELGWKLAWAVRGLAGEGLLDSHDAERGPVGRANAARSLRRDERDPGDGLPADLGRTYRSPVIAASGAAPAYRRDRAARPGERAPHVWVRRDGLRISMLDVLADRLTLLVGRDGARWARAAGTGGVQVLAAGLDVIDRRGTLARAYRLGPGAAVLVRPDGIVAWRHDGPCADHAGALAAAANIALGRAVAPAAARASA